MNLRLSAILTTLLTTWHLQAQELCELHRYDDINSSLEGHVTQILQDRNGLLWISTWNGLYRFDGYEFSRLKPLADDKCSMTSDRIRDICLAPSGDIFCHTDDGLFRFDISEYRFYNLDSVNSIAQVEEAFRQPTQRGHFHNGVMQFIDPQGLCWQVKNDVLYCLAPKESPVTPLHMEQAATVGTMQRDSKGRIWLTTKGDATVRLLDSKGQELGYLTPQGTLSPHYASFGHSVYAVFESSDGHLWLGSKPDGLFRLTEAPSGRFTVERVDGLTDVAVYSIAEDSRHRLWVGMLGQGVACIENPGSNSAWKIHFPQGYPADACQRVRRLYITDKGVMLATTTDGLVIAKVEDHVNDMTFRRHARDFRRPSSLCCNATMDVVETTTGRFFVSTETDGICEIVTPDLLADSLNFRRYNVQSGMMPTDMIQAMSQGRDENLFVVCNNQLVNLNIHSGTYENMGHLFFRHPYKFSDAAPLLLDDGRWLVGTTEDAFFLPQSLAHRSNFQPKLLLTGVSIEQQTKNLAVENVDTLLLQPDERNLTIHFAALDYTDPTSIKYQFCLGTDSATWKNIGTDHSITLLDLRPGTYQLFLRSTNADGQWTDNVRTLTISVKPTFRETLWAAVLMVLLIAAVLAVIVATVLYIRRIKHRQQETLEKYLLLLNSSKPEDAPEPEPLPQPSTEADPFMQSVMDFVEKNIGNSDADMNQMAEACAVSRSVLLRRMKQLTGVTPADFLREARLKHACMLLRTSGLTVAEVAYHSGFSDPKYFSRSFKQSMGMSPSEYKASL